MISPSSIREGLVSDKEVIRDLCVQLGYELTVQDAADNIETMRNHPDYELRCILDEGKVVGFVCTCKRFRMVGPPFLQVIALVTDESVRGRGFGRALLKWAEDLATQKRIGFVGLYSQVKRTEAHGFYEKAGYARDKQSFFFKKDLSV